MNLGRFLYYFKNVFIITWQIQYTFTVSQGLDRPINLKPNQVLCLSVSVSTQNIKYNVTVLYLHYNYFFFQNTHNSNATKTTDMYLQFINNEVKLSLSMSYGHIGYVQAQCQTFSTSVLDGCRPRTPDTSSPGKEPQYPLNRGLGELQSFSGHFGGVKNSCPYRTLNPTSSCP